MEKVVLRKVKASELPARWTKSLKAKRGNTFTVTIVAEPQAVLKTKQATANPLFGIWADRTDIGDVAAYVRGLRRARFAGR
jgi:hypothetical protein